MGGFAQAAHKLPTSQSAVYKRVHELEQLFDMPLFDHSQRTARLTEKGEEMFVLARQLLRQRDAAVEHFSESGVTELTAMTRLPRLVALVQQHYPKVTLEPDVGGSLPLRDKLLADEQDLIIVPDTFADARLPAKAVGQVESAWMCQPGLLPAGPVRLQQLAHQRLLVPDQASGTGHRATVGRMDRGAGCRTLERYRGEQSDSADRPDHLGPGRELPATRGRTRSARHPRSPEPWAAKNGAWAGFQIALHGDRRNFTRD